MPPPDDPASGRPSPVSKTGFRPLEAVIAGLILGFTAFGLVLLVLKGSGFEWSWTYWGNSDGTFNRSVIFRNFGLLALALIALPLAIWRSWTAHSQSRTANKQHQLAERGQHIDRHQKGAELLVSDHPYVRIAGIQTLRGLATAQPEENYLNVQELFFAYIREKNRHLRQKALKNPSTLPPFMEEDTYQAVTAITYLRTTIDNAADLEAGWEPHLKNADFRSVDLEGANLSGVNFDGADLSEAKLETACLSKALLFNGQLSKAHLHRADMTGTYLHKAVLKEAVLIEAILANADCNEADFSDAKMAKADLTEGSFEEAIFTNAKMNLCDCTDGKFISANLKGVKLVRADMTGAMLIDADLTQAIARHATFSDADCGRAKLVSADLTEAKLNGVDFKAADLSGAFLIGADLTGANLTNADLTAADITNANLTGANLSGANLNQITLSAATNLTGIWAKSNNRPTNLRTEIIDAITYR